jgi:hypothetical protein
MSAVQISDRRRYIHRNYIHVEAPLVGRSINFSIIRGSSFVRRVPRKNPLDYKRRVVVISKWCPTAPTTSTSSSLALSEHVAPSDVGTVDFYLGDWAIGLPSKQRRMVHEAT